MDILLLLRFVFCFEKNTLLVDISNQMRYNNLVNKIKGENAAKKETILWNTDYNYTA